jgi:hypothetical protein
MNPRQLKRKVRDMETQALKLTDKVIKLEVALKNKNETIDKHLKRIRLLNEKNSEELSYQLLQMWAPLEPCLQLERSWKINALKQLLSSSKRAGKREKDERMKGWVTDGGKSRVLQ